MAAAPLISVVVATFNRSSILNRTLDCLVRQDFDPSAFEIIVVNDGSTDNTEEVVRSVAATAPMPMHYFAHENRGPGFTQNVGIRAACGHLILLVADDIFLTPGALKAHVSRHERYPEAHVAVLGKAVPSPDLVGTGFLNERDAFGLQRFDHLTELPYILFWAFNLSLKRQFVMERGLFREPRGRGGAAAHEDTELGYRLHRHGMRLLYAKDAVGYHHHPVTLEQAADRYHERGLNYGELLAHAPDPLLPVFFRVLELRSLADYRRAMQDCPWLDGADRYFAWHLFRHAARWLLFNRVTASVIWRPLLNRRHHCDSLAAIVQARLCGPYLFYHFLAGIREARWRFF